MAQGVGVDDHRHVVGTGLGEHRARVVTTAGAHDPGLDAAVADDLGVRAAHGVGDRLRPDVADHPDQPGVRARHGEQRGTRVGARARAYADHAAGVLVRDVVGPRQQGAYVVGLERLDHRRAELRVVEAEVDEVDGTAREAGGVDEVGDLVGAEGDRQVGADVRAVEGAAVDVDAGRHVDRDDGHRGEALERRHRVGTEPRATADADDAVHQHVGHWVEGVEVPGRPAPGGTQGGEPRVVHAVGEEERLHRRAPGREPGSRPQRVATVVPGADQQEHAPAVAAAEQVEDRGGQSRSGALHQGAVGQAGHRGRLRAAYVLDEVGAQHGQLSSTTTAEAMPASWDSETWTWATPIASARAATVPRISNRGRPVSSETISASCHAIPTGAPSALAIASLAANRAASEAGGRDASASVNSRAAQRRRALEGLHEAVDVDHVDTDADDRHALLLALTRP